MVQSVHWSVPLTTCPGVIQSNPGSLQKRTLGQVLLHQGELPGVKACGHLPRGYLRSRIPRPPSTGWQRSYNSTSWWMGSWSFFHTWWADRAKRQHLCLSPAAPEPGSGSLNPPTAAQKERVMSFISLLSFPHLLKSPSYTAHYIVPGNSCTLTPPPTWGTRKSTVHHTVTISSTWGHVLSFYDVFFLPFLPVSFKNMKILNCIGFVVCLGPLYKITESKTDQ